MFNTKLEAQKVIRSTTAQWDSTDKNGQTGSEEITVEYYGVSIAEIRRNKEEFATLKLTGESWFVSDTLARRIYKLNGETVTKEWLEEQDITNLMRLEQAILDADNPEKK